MKTFKEFYETLNESFTYKGITIVGISNSESLSDSKFWVNKLELSPENIEKVVLGGILYNKRKHMEDYNKKSSIVKVNKIYYNKTDLEGTAIISVTLDSGNVVDLKMLNDDFNKPTEWYLTKESAEYSYSKSPIR
jgi:hypothetical protein